jgi:F-type H+-transporting ATPase subunit epsilon
MAALQFSAVTAEGVVAEAETDSVTVPTKDGEITVLPHHIPLVSVLIPGVVTYRDGERERHLAVSGGFLQVTGTELNLLADTAERADDIDAARAERARKQAAEAMAGRLDKEEYVEAAAELQKHLARIRAADLIKQKHRQG